MAFCTPDRPVPAATPVVRRERGPRTGHHARGRRDVTSMPPQTSRAALGPPRYGRSALATLGFLFVAVFASAQTRPPTAPLDTLVASPAPQVSTGAIVMTRSTLPDISTTTVPRQAPPAVPPRLDDPAAGERFFRAAVHAARNERRDQADTAIRSALAARPGDSRLPLWQVMQALRTRDPGGLVYHLPGAWRAIQTDPLAAPRLALHMHQAAVLLVAVYWTLLVTAVLAALWRSLAHDLSALLFRGADHRLRNWTPWLVVGVVLLVRPGWLGALGLISIPLLLQARGMVRAHLLGTWLVAMALAFPSWPLLRESVPVIDPDSETMLLVRASREDASTAVMQQLRERLAAAEQPQRQQRLLLALGVQEARRGRFSASSEHFQAVLQQRPHDVNALVGLANNAYYLSRFDEALRGYQRARELAPDRGEIPFNMAQVYFKKLFVPEAGQALEDARRLGFAPVNDAATTHGASDFSATVYLDLSRQDLRASAQLEAGLYPPLAAVAAWNYFLGAPPLPLYLLLGGLLAVALLMLYWGASHLDVRCCESCGTEICRGCCSVHEDTLICPACTETAERSRSEMVLATLLKNRSRAVGLATTARLARLARLLPGAAHLAIGQTGRAVRRLALLALAVFLIGGGWAFDPASERAAAGLLLAEEAVHPLWLPLPAAAWPGWLGWPLVAGWLLLAVTYALALMDAARLRQRLPERLVQQHSGPLPGPGRI